MEEKQTTHEKQYVHILLVRASPNNYTLTFMLATMIQTSLQSPDS